jgi:hypothetical protein
MRWPARPSRRKGIRAQIGVAFAGPFTRLADAFTEALVRSQVALTGFRRGHRRPSHAGGATICSTRCPATTPHVVDQRFVQWRDGIIDFGRQAWACGADGVVVPAFRRLLRDTAEAVE